VLVTLGTNQALGANSAQTFPYACNSVQRVFIKVDDDATASGYNVTVQLGQRTIINGASGFGLLCFNALYGGDEFDGSEAHLSIDLGNHELLDNENLYVTVTAGSAALTAVDVSALVDEPGNELPIRYTEYSDNTFTAENVKMALCFSNGGSAIDEDATNCEIRNSISSSSPTFISSTSWYSSTAIHPRNSAGLLCSNPVPLTTSFNYPSSATVDRILIASQMSTTARAVAQGRRSVQQAKQAVTRGRI